MAKAYLGIGSNLGPRQENIRRAIEKLNRLNGIFITKISSLIETKPQGPPQAAFLNGALEVETALPAEALLKKLKEIEFQMGRRPNGIKWGPRVVDIDILLFNDRIIDSQDLKVPHPLMHSRLFVLEPLCQIAPDLRHPLLNKTVRDLLSELKHKVAAKE
jgi:2-amino-4-hydroxy-6-hydroxymethyldihydropteridine diphosphokinase